MAKVLFLATRDKNHGSVRALGGGRISSSYFVAISITRGMSRGGCGFWQADTRAHVHDEIRWTDSPRRGKFSQ